METDRLPGAHKAISTLTTVRDECGPAALAFWVLPNIILTLSGARPFCDGVFWSDDTAELESWRDDMQQSIKVIMEHADVAEATAKVEAVRDGETYASSELLLCDGWQYVASHTSLLGTAPPTLAEATSVETFVNELRAALRQQERFKGFSDENIGHVASGLLLGYPDAAITESVLLWEADDPFMEQLIDADIRGARYYICPQPVYSYPRRLVNDTSIKEHEQLWSQILRDYYRSSFHAQLEKDASFVRKMEELRNFR